MATFGVEDCRAGAIQTDEGYLVQTNATDKGGVPAQESQEGDVVIPDGERHLEFVYNRPPSVY